MSNPKTAGSSDDSPEMEDEANSTDSATSHVRSRRQAEDPLDTTIDRMQIIARLTNAIYLQQGLLDGSVLPYDVIAELLFFGDVKQDALNDPGIGKVFEEIKTLPEKLAEMGDVEKSEKLFNVLVKIQQEISGVTAVDKWTLKDSLMADLENLKATPFDFKLLKDLKTTIASLEANKNNIEKLATEKKEGQAKAIIDFIASGCQELINKATELSKNIDATIKVPSGKNVSASFSDVYKLSNAVNFFESNKLGLTRKPESQVKMSQMVDLMSLLSKSVAQINPFLESVNVVLQNRKVADRRRLLKLTSGFPSGYDELESFPTVLSDEWLKGIAVTESFAKAFPPLEKFIESVKEVSDGLGPIRNQNPGPMDKVSALVKDLIKSGSIPVEAKTITDPTFQCFDLTLGSSDIETINLKVAQEELQKIDKKMTEIRSALKTLTDFINSEDNSRILKEVGAIAALATSDDVALLKDTVHKLVNYKDKDKFNQMFLTFEKLLSHVDTNQIDPSKILDNEEFKKIDNFQSKSLALFKTMLECLQKQNGPDVELAHRLFLKSKDFQKPVDNPLKQDMSQVTKLVDTLQKVKAIDDVIDKMKTSRNEESEALAALDTPSKHSETLGHATCGIVNFRDVIAQKPDFATIQTHVQLVNDKLKPDLSQFQTMSDALDVWKSTVALPDSQKLEDYSKVFLDAKSISGIDDVKKISDDVEKLRKSIQDPIKQKNLGDLKKALDDLDSIGLDFVRYQQSFGDSEDSLKALDLFFVKFQEILEPSTIATTEPSTDDPSTDAPSTNAPETSDPQNNAPQTAAPIIVNPNPEAVSSKATKMDSTTVAPAGLSFGWILIYAGIAGVSILVVGGAVWLIIRCIKKKNEEEDDEEKDEKPKPSNVEPPPTVVIPPPPNKTEQPNETVHVLQPPPTSENKPANIQKQADVTEHKKKKKEPGTFEDMSKKKSSKKEEVKKVEKKDSGPKLVVAFVLPLLPAKGFEIVLGDLRSKLFALQATPKPGKGKNDANKDEKKAEPKKLEIDILKRYIETFSNVAYSTVATNRYYRLYQYQNEQENRYQILVNKDTDLYIHMNLVPRCFYQGQYFNGNCCIMPNKARFFMTQTPILGTKEVVWRTDDKFLYFLAQTKTDVVIFLCDLEEVTTGWKYIRDGVVKSVEKNYGKYFPDNTKAKTLVIKNAQNKLKELLVTCTEYEVLIPNVLIRRKLRLKYYDSAKEPKTDEWHEPGWTTTTTSDGPQTKAQIAAKFDDLRLREGSADVSKEQLRRKREERHSKEFTHKDFLANKIDHTVDHYQVLNWPEHGVPENTEVVRKLMDIVAGKPNVLVHCTDGTERTGAFVCAEYARQELSMKMSANPKDGFVDYTDAMIKVRRARNGAIEEAHSMAFVVRTIMDYAKEQYKCDWTPLLTKKSNHFDTLYTYAITGLLPEDPTQVSCKERKPPLLEVDKTQPDDSIKEIKDGADVKEVKDSQPAKDIANLPV